MYLPLDIFDFDSLLNPNQDSFIKKANKSLNEIFGKDALLIEKIKSKNFDDYIREYKKIYEMNEKINIKKDPDRKLNITYTGGNINEVRYIFNYLVWKNKIKNMFIIFPIYSNGYNYSYTLYSLFNIFSSKLNDITRIFIPMTNKEISGEANHAVGYLIESDNKNKKFNIIFIDTSCFCQKILINNLKKNPIQYNDKKNFNYFYSKIGHFDEEIKNMLKQLDKYKSYVLIYKVIKLFFKKNGYKMIKLINSPVLYLPLYLQQFGDCWLKCVIFAIESSKNKFIYDSESILEFNKKSIYRTDYTSIDFSDYNFDIMNQIKEILHIF